MKISIALVGNYLPHRIEYNMFENNINFLKEQFKDYDFEIYIFIWKLHDNELINKISKLAKLYMNDSLDPSVIANNISCFKNCKHDKSFNLDYINKHGTPLGGSYINIYNMYYLRKIALQKLKDISDYTFLLRVDLRIDFINIEDWISNNMYHTIKYRAWRNIAECLNHNLYGCEHIPISDHCSIGETQLLLKFYNMDDNEINNLFQISQSAEDSILNRLRQLNIKFNKHSNPNVDKMWLISTGNQ